LSAQFPGNIIPANRVSPQGYSMLNLFPLPFTTDPTGQRQYKAIYQWPLTNIHEDRVLRVDGNLNAKTQTYAVRRQDYSSNRGNGVPNGPSGGGWGQVPSSWDLPSVGGSLNVIRTFTPNLINEFKFGFSLALNLAAPLSDSQYATNKIAALRDQNGQPVNLPAIIPGANPINVIPRISFAANNAQSAGQGVTNAPTFGWGAFWPFWSRDKEFSLGHERARALQFRMETFNTFNHFNPGNPNTSLSYNYLTGAQTNANFGAITTAQNPSRRMVLSLRVRF
jgi:hypothetical protein